MKIEIRCPCHPTEDVRKVERAIRNIFPDLEITRETDHLTGTGESIETFSELLKSQRIRSAARAVLLSSLSGNVAFFSLNKQVAFVGKVSFGSGSPLGDIEVRLHDENIEDIIDIIAPRMEAEA